MDEILERKLCAQQYIDYTPYKLRNWIDEDKLNLQDLKSNPRAHKYIINKYGLKSLQMNHVPMGLFYVNPNSMLLIEYIIAQLYVIVAFEIE